MPSCGTCPDAVTFTLRRIVQDQLDNVRSIKSLTDALSRALQDIAGLADLDITGLLDGIPDIPAIDFTDILGYLTCPLTPLALALDLSQIQALDPTVQLQKLKRLAQSEIEQARATFEDALTASPYRQLINIARRFATEITRIRFDEVRFAEAVLISATVLAVCGTDEYQDGPYQDFANEVQDFSFVGGVPADLETNVAAIVQKLVQSELKFKAAAAALT